MTIKSVRINPKTHSVYASILKSLHCAEIKTMSGCSSFKHVCGFRSRILWLKLCLTKITLRIRPYVLKNRTSSVQSFEHYVQVFKSLGVLVLNTLTQLMTFSIASDLLMNPQVQCIPVSVSVDVIWNESFS